MRTAVGGFRRRWWLVPVAVIIVAGSLATNLGRVQGADPVDHPARSVAAIVLAVLSTAVLVVLDRWPAATIAVGALAGAYFAVGGANGPVFFVLVVAALLLSSRRRPRQWVPLLLGAAVLTWAGLVIRGVRWDDLSVSLWQVAGVGALISAAAAIATAARTREEVVVSNRQRAATEERLRMAQDLHDGVGHGLAVIAMQAGVALHVLDRDPAAVREALVAIRDTSRESLDSLRAELSHLTGAAAPRAPRRGLADLGTLVDRVGAAGVELSVTGTPPASLVDLPDDVDAAAYALVQEALTNVLRHAEARTASVVVERGPDSLTMIVTDDGRGGVVHDEGMGLRGMRERVRELGGTLAAGPGEAGGFRVHARIPVGPA